MYLQNISNLNADNIGGLISIQVARKADIVSIAYPVDGVIYGPIPTAPGTGFVTWQVTAQTPGTDSAARQSREGTSKGNRLKFSVPKDRSFLRAMFEQASEDELIVLFVDSNGQQKIFGQLDKPVLFRFNHSTGNSPSQKNAYECEFYFDGPENIFEYNGTLPAPPVGAPPALVKFNGVVVASLGAGETLNIISDYSWSDYFTTV